MLELADNFIWEYANGSTLTFKAEGLNIQYDTGVSVDMAVDGTLVVQDTANTKRTLTFNCLLNGDDTDTLDALIMASSIVYTGIYPHIQFLYWDADSKETQLECAMTQARSVPEGNNMWRWFITLEQKDQ